jgi:hypothetical protein
MPNNDIRIALIQLILNDAKNGSHSAFCTRRWRYASGSSFPSADYLREDIHGDYGFVILQVILVHELLVDGEREGAKPERTHPGDGLFDSTNSSWTRIT